jgi:hypothetical protein
MAQALPFIYLGATVLAGGASVVSQRRAGALQQIAYKEQAKQEEFSARDREIERRRRLVQAIASQNAEAGALGLDPTMGSRRAIMLEDVKRARFDDLTDRAMTTRRATSLKSAGRESRRQANFQSDVTLLDTAGSVANAWPG